MKHPLDVLYAWRGQTPRADPIAMLDGQASPQLAAELDRLAGQVPAAAACDRPLTDAGRVLVAVGQWAKQKFADDPAAPLDRVVLAALWAQTELWRLGGDGVHEALLRDPVPPALVVAARDFLGVGKAQTQFAELRLEVGVTTRSGHARAIELWRVAGGLTRPLALRIAAEQLALARRGQPYEDALFLAAALAASKA
jgi:hypothetical protein